MTSGIKRFHLTLIGLLILSQLTPLLSPDLSADAKPRRAHHYGKKYNSPKVLTNKPQQKTTVTPANTSLILPQEVLAPPVQDPAMLIPTPKTAAELLEDAKAAEKEGQLTEAFTLTKQAAELGAANAQYLLGKAYETGKGTSIDLAQAKANYEKAAAQNNADALNALGTIYLSGLGVEKDPAKGKDWIEKAANLKLPLAQFNMGMIYYRGYGATRNADKAREWFQRAAGQNMSTAKAYLGMIHLKGIGVPRDPKSGLSWMTLAAEDGEPLAQFTLGVLHEMGIEAPRDITKAKTWYEKAANGGDSYAQFNLGTLYENGKLDSARKPNYPSAAEWYEKSAQQGNPKAQYTLGLLYLNGKGVEKNSITAYKWLTLSNLKANETVLRSLQHRMPAADLEKAKQAVSDWTTAQNANKKLSGIR